MRKALLYRKESSDEGTFGELVTDAGFKCSTGELPWRDNKPNMSCVPPGVYSVTWRKSERFGFCFHVENVPGRDDILIHAANFVGDKEKHLRSEVLGCIAVGMIVSKLTGQKALLQSRLALSKLEEEMEHAPFELTIIGEQK